MLITSFLNFISYRLTLVINIITMSIKLKAKDVRDDIIEHLKTEERSMRWLAGKIEVNYTSLYNSIVRKWYKLSDDNLTKINKFFGTKFKNNQQ